MPRQARGPDQVQIRHSLSRRPDDLFRTSALSILLIISRRPFRQTHDSGPWSTIARATSMAWLADPARPSRVLVFGCGAVGTVIAYFFTKAGHDVTVVCRSNYGTAQACGLSVDLNGDIRNFHPHVTRSCIEAAAVQKSAYDIVVVTSKAVLSTDTAATIAPVVTPGRTVILLVQNGVGIESNYLSIFPENQILTSVAYCFATQVLPGRTYMAGKAKLEIGPYPDVREGGDVPITTQIMMETLEDAGLAMSWHADIQERRWLKLVLNAPYNSMCALTRSDSGAILSGTGTLAMSVMHGVMDEIVATANALGYDSVKRETAEQLLKKSRQSSASKSIQPSMLVDIQQGREMEVEVILGNPLRQAKAVGVDTPRLEMLYLMSVVTNKSLARSKIDKTQVATGILPIVKINGQDLEV